ncbi:P-loop containing nucleoside triphosphate hydrolases superfamily protein isoform 1 [Hibiscus syriacus]|uniref:RING-type E3 ubiquitin transferase n=1 Tax=Hibiscus syriacus TaxID=106335 RepID=A0A6A3A3R3_HIBSY|nr:P-loop containing nucleoside triphosphate hydrolases superfamily protein isoform 1 [Hibiscus syriacus]
MADFTSYPSPSTAAAAAACSLFEKPVALTADSSSSPIPPSSFFDEAVDDGVEFGCCICLEPFTVHDPTTVTSCRHEYHLQCILEWSQRSKECPICWQSFVLKDPARNHQLINEFGYTMHLCSQQLLDAVRIERNCRSANNQSCPQICITSMTDLLMKCSCGSGCISSDDSDFDEHILQHLALTASRVRYGRRRERQRSSGLGPSQVFFSNSPENMPGTLHIYPNSPDESQTMSHELPQCNSQASGIPSVNTSPCSPVTPSVNMLVRNMPFVTCLTGSQPPLGTPSRPSSAESVSFSESINLNGPMLQPGTRGLKEKFLARNNSVKELSKGVHREMNAGVAKMIERLDISSKRPGASKPASGGTGRTLNFF